MVDCEGRELSVGDTVVYITKTYCTAGLTTGIITGFRKAFGKDCAVIGGGFLKSNPMSQSIYLLKKGKNESN